MSADEPRGRPVQAHQLGLQPDYMDDTLPFHEALELYEQSVLSGLRKDFHRIRLLLRHTRFSEQAQAWLLKALIQLSEEVQDQ